MRPGQDDARPDAKRYAANRLTDKKSQVNSGGGVYRDQDSKIDGLLGECGFKQTKSQPPAKDPCIIQDSV